MQVDDTAQFVAELVAAVIKVWLVRGLAHYAENISDSRCR